MKKYLIIICDNCKKTSMASDSQKTRLCPYCGNNIKILGTQIIAKTESLQQARTILAIRKKEQYQSKHPNDRTHLFDI